MDETDLIKLSILGRYKEYRVNEKNRKNFLQIGVQEGGGEIIERGNYLI